MLDLNQLATPNMALHEFVLVIFLFMTGLYAIFSGILYFHWKEYATDKKVAVYTLVTYFSLTIPLIAAMGILALIIN